MGRPKRSRRYLLKERKKRRNSSSTYEKKDKWHLFCVFIWSSMQMICVTRWNGLHLYAIGWSIIAIVFSTMITDNYHVYPSMILFSLSSSLFRRTFEWIDNRFRTRGGGASRSQDFTTTKKIGLKLQFYILVSGSNHLCHVVFVGKKESPFIF